MLRGLRIKGYHPHRDTIPQDVVAIDILYKEEASPNIYIVDTIKPDDDILEGETINAWFKGGSCH